MRRDTCSEAKSLASPPFELMICYMTQRNPLGTISYFTTKKHGEPGRGEQVSVSRHVCECQRFTNTSSFRATLPEALMRSKLKIVDENSCKKRFHDWIFLRLLLIFERGIFWLLYTISMMESDEVFVSEEPKPRSPNSPGKNYKEFKTMTSDHKDRTRAISVPHMPSPAKNPVKDFISNFVNRKGTKKRATIKRSVTTENLTDEKAAVRHVGRGHSFVSCHLRNPTWCDCCGEFIWGLFKQCVRCKSK